MEANESSSGLTTSYSSTYPSHHQQPPQQPPSTTETITDNNGKSASVEPEQKKRGRPRKYSTPEEAAAAAAKRATILAAKRKAERERQHLFRGQSAGHSGGADGGLSGGADGGSSRSVEGLPKTSSQGFMPHVINVAAGEDVGQKIILLMQQTKRELCILSASGSIASAALRQPASSGGSVAYQGRFDIISLTGSYVRSDQGGKAGGLSVCLSSENGLIVGGGVCGPLIAAGPVEVVVATFLIEPKKDVSGGFKGEASPNIMPIPVSASPAIYRQSTESSGGFPVTGRNDHQNMNGNSFLMQSQWRAGLNFDLSGNTGQDSHESPEDGDYEHMPD